jgi:hypothetical protein
MACASLFLFASASAAGAGRVGRDEGCARIRSGNTRVFHLPTTYLNAYLNDHSGLIGAGWRLGVLHRACEGERFGPFSACTLSAYRQGSPPALEYVYRSSATTSAPTDPQLQADLVRALIEWRPSYVQPAMVDSVQLMHATVRAYANASAADVRTAVQTLRCSLGAEKLWEERVSKTLLIAAAGRIGIRTPWTRRVRATRMKGDEIKEFESLLPLVIKSDRDGGGVDVRICHDRTCLKAALKRKAKAGERVIQQYVSGPTLAYDGTCLDGQILGGFARAEVLSVGRRGYAFLLQTIDAPEVARMAAKLAAHLRYTGAPRHAALRLTRCCLAHIRPAPSAPRAPRCDASARPCQATSTSTGSWTRRAASRS